MIIFSLIMGGLLFGAATLFSLEKHMYPQLYYTVSSKELRAGIPATAVLFSAASFYRVNSRGQGSLRVPSLCVEDSL